MCVLSKLKKKLHLKKLTQFLNQYKYIVFYHSNKGHVLRDKGLITNIPKKVLFLVNSARIRQLSKAKVHLKHSAQMHTYKDTLKDCTNYTNLLGGVASGGAVGSLFLVGCSSLEHMQGIIKENNSLSKTYKEGYMDCTCLGAMCEGSFKDHLDCKRLSEMPPSVKNAQEKSVCTLGKIQHNLLHLFSRPQSYIHLTLMAAGSRTPSTTD